MLTRLSPSFFQLNAPPHTTQTKKHSQNQNKIAVPSRTDVPEYQRLRSMVHEIVGRINGAFGTLTYVPIHHLDRQLSFTELCALYAVTDVALITSLRDGMNLVSYEYVACQADNAGVLVLSEFAGAAQSLGAGALLVNLRHGFIQQPRHRLLKHW